MLMFIISQVANSYEPMPKDITTLLFTILLHLALSIWVYQTSLLAGDTI